MNKIMTALVTFALAFSFAGTASAAGKPVTLKDCNSTYENVTLKSVTVLEGSSCVLKGVTVTHGVHAKKGAENLSVLDSTVGRNIQANGVTENVVIGQSGCKFDPTVGNNVHVTNSHNVLICWVSTKNNIMVTRNDGKVTVRDSVAGNNLMVTRNKKFVADGSEAHRFPEWVRVFRNGYDNNLFTSNPARTVKVKGNYNF